MKKFLINLCAATAAVIALAGCSAMKYPFLQEVYCVDYHSAGLGGKVFLTESNSVSFDYTPIASITVHERSGQVKSDKQIEQKEQGKQKRERPKGDDIYGEWESNKEPKVLKGWRNTSFQSALEKASRTAIEMGGDAIINLQMQYIPYVEGSPNQEFNNQVYVKGMVVKRK